MGEHTQLNGAVIGSTASADKNRLDTGTLGFSDIHNQADYKVEHQSIGLSTGGSIGSQFAGNLANTMLAGVNDEGHDSGTTRAAVSDGTLVVRDQDKQGQDVAQLSRDVEHANGSISQIFDKEKEQQRIQQAQLVGEMVSQATDIVRSEMAIHATEAAKAKLATASKDDLDKARQDILDKNPKANPDAKDIASQAYQNYYDAEVKASGFGVGGTYSRVMDTAGAVIKGLAGNDLGAALAGGAAPWIADFIGHKSGLDNAGKIAAHAVVNAALAAAQGQNAAAGAAGAITGELTGMIAAEMYGKKAGALTESEKETVSALATLASGLAGGLVGDSTQSAAYAAQTGKTTVENNNLASVLAAAEGHKPGTVEKWQKEQQAAIKEACSGGTPVSCELAVAVMGTVISPWILPEAMVISGTVGAGAVGVVDYGLTGSVDPKNVIGAYWTGVLTRYTGFKSTVAINAASGAITSSIDGKNPFLYGTISGVGGAIGYGLGNKILAPMMDDYFNPISKTIIWDDIGMGISRPSKINPLPGIAGTLGGGVAGEVFNVISDPNKPENDKKEAAQ